MNELLYWLIVQDNKNIIPYYILDKIINEHNSLEEFWKLNKNKIMELGLDSKKTNNFIKFKNKLKINKYIEVLDKIDKDNIEIIKYTDKNYPLILKRISEYNIDPPILIFKKGNYDNFNNCVGIVGTRNASYYSRKKAREFSQELAKKRYTIISGLARGIDYEAHSGALDIENGKTIAVLAWMNPLYPPEHEEFSKDVIRNGCIISENYLGNGDRFSFVERNRIISGLSKFIIAVESGPKGGTIRQVEYAIAQRRPVYTLYPPNNASPEMLSGFDTMIRMGVKTINNVLDIHKIETYI